ncbi:MAG TPA: RDD family protein [Mycobacteriales bacterium]|nr:RDD family protein [Mycobacteriales bacterium]
MRSGTAEEHQHRGADLGLPASGPGSVASVRSRVVAFVLDVLSGIALGGGIVAVFLGDVTELERGLVHNAAFATQVVVLQALTGQSLGMRLVGIRVLRPASRDDVPGLLPAAVRTALLMLLVPALVYDRAGRGLHDRAAGTVIVRA